MQKEKVRQILEAFPEDIDIDALMEKLFLLEKTETAERELANGEDIPDDEIEEYEPSALAQDTDEPRRIFHALATEWKAGRGHCSKAKDLAMHPAYQRIIGMGETAIPLILEEMRRCPSQWTWALRAITGADPVPKESRGKLKEMTAAWVKWGIEKGYIE